jgi:hypothetical protein
LAAGYPHSDQNSLHFNRPLRIIVIYDFLGRVFSFGILVFRFSSSGKKGKTSSEENRYLSVYQ